MGLITFVKEPGRRGCLISRLYGGDEEDALAAVEALDAEGWLTDGSMRGADLREASLPDADLSEADLEEANLRDSVLAGANLTASNLAGANLWGADLEDAILSNAVLDGADLQEANLQGATVTDTQLVRASALAGATMTDGSLYDGRYRLPGDLSEAEQDYLVAAPGEMADFYGVPIDVYARGQMWAEENRDALLDERVPLLPSAEDIDEGELAEDLFNVRDYIDHFDLITASFEDPEWLEAYRRVGNHRQYLWRMAAWLVTGLVILPYALGTLLALFYIPYHLRLFNLGQPGASLLLAFGLLGPVVLLILVPSIAWVGAQPAGKGRAARWLVYILLFLTGSRPLIALALMVAYVLGSVVLFAVGSRANRAFFSNMVIVLLARFTPLYVLFHRVVLPSMFQYLPRAVQSVISRQDGNGWEFLIYSVAMLALSILEAFIIVRLLDWFVKGQLLGWRRTSKGAALGKTLLGVYLVIVVGYTILTAITIPVAYVPRWMLPDWVYYLLQ